MPDHVDCGSDATTMYSTGGVGAQIYWLGGHWFFMRSFGLAKRARIECKIDQLPV